jgi:hypothetical protein
MMKGERVASVLGFPVCSEYRLENTEHGMPVIYRYKGYRFFFYSNEGNPREPVHVHVRAGDGEAKFWLYPHVHIADSGGFDARTLRELVQVIECKTEDIEKAWHEYFC